MHNLKDKEYEQFTPVERINLTIAALARGDIEEADRCWDTCPRHDYKALDFDYTVRIDATMMLRMEFREKCFYHHYKIKLVEAHILHLECFIGSENFEKSMQKLVAAQNFHISMIKAAHEALELFCRDVGLCYENFLKNCHIDENCNDINLYLANDITLDVEFIAHYKHTFAGYWQI